MQVDPKAGRKEQDNNEAGTVWLLLITARFSVPIAVEHLELER